MSHVNITRAVALVAIIPALFGFLGYTFNGDWAASLFYVVLLLVAVTIFLVAILERSE